MIQSLLCQVGASIDAVHQLQRAVWISVVGAVLEPAHERFGLLGEADAQQPVEGKGGVPYPGVAVVPVALPTYALRQAGRGGRDNGPGRLVGEQLERQRRAVDHLAPAAGVGGLRKPAAPVLDGSLE